ncbi:MAG: ABC transporter permease [Actinobacteria bacterium]|nr:ABC transporter permease [Actinomycetota bacterium]
MTAEAPAHRRHTRAAAAPAADAGSVSALEAGRIIASSTFRDTARRRGSWTTTLLTGVLFAVLIISGGSVSERLQERAEQISFRVSVDGDRRGGQRLLDQLATDELRVESSTDAATDVTNSRSAVGIRLPDRVDERIDRNEAVELMIFYRGGANTSREAYNNLLLRLQEIELARIDRAVDVGPAVQVEEQQVRRDERVNRLQFARILAALAAILCLGVVSSVAAVFGQSNERRSLEPLLLLPFNRTILAAGTTAGALPVAILQLVAAIALLVFSSALPVIGLSLSWSTVAQVLALSLVGVALLGALACSSGSLAGVMGGGSDDAVSVGDFFALPFVAVGILLFLRPAFPTSPLTSALPIIGPSLLIRDGAGAELSILNAVIAVVTTVAWCALLIRAAARRLDAERAVTRSIR